MRGMHHALRGVVLLLACFASNLPPATARYQAKPPPEFCDQYEAVYKSIDQDLELYRNNGGITPELMARTMSLHTAGARDNYPVFRFGKSAAHPDILIPNFHFYMKAYQRKFLDKIKDILEAVDWARQHDQQAHRIALAGQQLAARYLTSEARACFWLRLFQAYAATLTYDPVQYRNITFSAEGEREGRGEEAVAAAGLRFLKPVARFIEEDVATTFPLLLSELEWEP
eukprot:XP_001699365.1 predicted protein [Chlamydomonas reinhardtii]